MLHQIGVGALGPVFRTYEPNRDRLVAVKVFRLDITPEQARALADELGKVADAGLFHPSIVEPIGAGVEGVTAYAAEEYVAAESLDVAMRDVTPAPVATALPLVTQLAGAIDFARASGVGHGALHPRDIFVTAEDVRATGFGVVEAVEGVGLRAPVRRPYSAPERIEGHPWSTPADVFSLAAITFELLTGRRPAGLGAEIGPLTAGSPNGWLDALHAVLARAMDRDPGRRPPTALAFASALEAAARGDFAAAGVASVAASGLAEPSGDGKAAGVEPDGHPRDEDVLLPPAEPEDSPVELALAEQEADDIAQERDDDEAHHELTLQEMSEPPPADDDLDDSYAARDATVDVAPVEDAVIEEDADRFVADALASAPLAFADDFREPSAEDLPGRAASGEMDREPPLLRQLGEVDAPQAVGAEPDDASQPAVGASENQWFGRDEPLPTFRSSSMFQSSNDTSPAAAEIWEPDAARMDERPERSPMWMAAVLLVAGLLGGLAAGYVLWGRGALPAAQPDTGMPAVVGAGSPAQTDPAGPEPAAQEAAAPATPLPPAEAPPALGEREALATPEPARIAPPARGTLIIDSTPPGAGVVVNGTWRGRTPLVLSDLPLARHQVRVVEPGYTPVNRTVALTASAPEQTVAVRLEQQAPPTARGSQPTGPGAQPTARGTKPPAAGVPADRGTQAQAARPADAFTGAIYVDSRPRGAAVSINGKPVGVTPLRIPEMRIGTHVVRLELPDHRIWTTTARVTAGQEVRVTGSLDPIR